MKHKNLGAIALVAIGLLLLGQAPANAATFSVSVNKTAGLAIAGDTVQVTLNDLPVDTGVYVRLCQGTLADAATARPANCFGTGIWASNLASALAQGATDASKPLSLAVQASWTSGSTAIDCTKVACGIHIRRDHLGGATDFSLDRFIPVTFGVSGAVTAKFDGKHVTFSVSGYQGSKLSFQFGSQNAVRSVSAATTTFTFPVTKATKSLSVKVTSQGALVLKKTLANKG